MSMSATATSSTAAINQQQPNCLFTVRAMYLGSEPMGELLEGENGSDVIQAPLKRTILRTNGSGRACQLSITNDSVLVTFHDTSQTPSPSPGSTSGQLKLPIDMLAYCGALRQLPYDKIKQREFETLDKTPFNASNIDPPLFVTIFRSIEKENTLYCHSFVIHRDEEAMELVKLVMEIYYNLIRLQEMEENNTSLNEINDILASVQPNANIDYKRSFNKETKELLNKLAVNSHSKIKILETIQSNIDKLNLNETKNEVEKEPKQQSQNDYLNELLNDYNKGQQTNQQNSPVRTIDRDAKQFDKEQTSSEHYMNEILPYIDFSNKELVKKLHESSQGTRKCKLLCSHRFIKQNIIK
jgi:hypothetical protein